MSTRSQDRFPRGTVILDNDGDTWRKGTAWWHWTGRTTNTGPGKLLWPQLIEKYGPVQFVDIPGGPRCSVCDSHTDFVDTHWVCLRVSCGSEWDDGHGPEFVAPGDRPEVKR